jgi:cofilin
LLESFQGIAHSKVCFIVCLKNSGELTETFSPQPFVTELDLRLAHVPQAAIDYLVKAMPSGPNESGEPEYDYVGWLNEVFAAQT